MTKSIYSSYPKISMTLKETDPSVFVVQFLIMTSGLFNWFCFLLNLMACMFTDLKGLSARLTTCEYQVEKIQRNQKGTFIPQYWQLNISIYYLIYNIITKN